MLFLELLIVLAAALTPGEEREMSDAIRRGDRTAFRRFFEEYHGALLRYLVHRNVAPDAAEDLVQNAFVYVWERREKIREDGSLRGLLYRIAHTRALNLFRDGARFVDATPEAVEPMERSSDPAEGRDIRDQVAAAVAALPEKRRAVFELCMLEGFSYREASEALEISPKTVENHMGMALKTVREKLAGLR
ncbi:MAG: RNA polymerase sigma-70 factor (ECF subfamily) [Rhodothermales bacterium]